MSFAGVTSSVRVIRTNIEQADVSLSAFECQITESLGDLPWPVNAGLAAKTR
jgi:hypothetical protein